MEYVNCSGFVNANQIKHAREFDVLDYILTYESGNIKRVGNSYRLKDHPSLSVNHGKWYWHSVRIKGTDLLYRQTIMKAKRLQFLNHQLMHSHIKRYVFKIKSYRLTDGFFH